MKEGLRPLTLLFFTLILLKLTGAINPIFALQDSTSIYIKWIGPVVKLQEDGTEQKVLNHLEVIYLDEYSNIPFYQVIIQEAQINNLSISHVAYEDNTEEESALLENLTLKDIPAPLTQVKYAAGKPVSYIFMPTVTVDSINQQKRKIKSFTLRYTLDPKNIDALKRTSGFRNSVLATGDWYKFAIPQKGIYKLTYDQLKRAGIPIDDVDPKHIKIFGNGGGMLPQKNDLNRHKDLMENSPFISGEDDGKFSREDYILFYGQGADKIEFNPLKKSFEYERNVYSDSTFYYLTVNPDPGLKVGNQANLGESFPIVDHFDDYIVHEKDIISVNNSGREWYGEVFNNLKLSNDFKFPAEGLLENSEIKITCSFLALAYKASSYSLSLNNFDVGSVNLGIVSEGQYMERGVVSRDSFQLNSSFINLPANTLNVKLTYNRSSNLSSAYLDYLFLSIRRKLSLYNSQTFFRSSESTRNSNTTYRISNLTPSSMIWDITNPLSPVNQLFSIVNNQAIFGASSTELKEFVVFEPAKISTPVFIEKVANQNLQGEGLFDMVIVTVDKFKEEAQRLADFRAAKDQLSIKVTTVQEIYNEFSSGAKDVTALRDYMKYLYDLGANGQGLKYLLLFGKSSYDIKNKIQGNINFVPIYGSRNSLHPIYSYSSDDYYGFLDDGEGEWNENSSGDHLMDIGIGRIPVRDKKEAKLVVDKIIHYDSSPLTMGAWRKEICFVADDGDFNLHQLDADKLANLVDTTYSEFNVNKIYLDSYPQVDMGNDIQSAPEVNKAINDALKSGSLIINYTGHGGQYKWADEGILDTEMISKWKNHHKLPFFVTATCTFGKHDDPISQSGGEKMLLDIRGGAIGLITSSRPVFSSTNYALNLSFYNFVFKQVNGEFLTIGDIFKEVKNSSLKGSINRNFSLLGDPSMKLSYPKKNIEITSVNDNAVIEAGDTLKALSKVNIKGKIQDLNGADIQSFNGVLYASIYDKLYTTTTLGTPSMDYQERSSTVFRGKSSIIDGKFNFDFVVPKNISYDFNIGKISLYAVNTEKDEDATGSNKKIRFGGSNPESVADREPPELKLYLNDTTFRNNGIAPSNSLLLARLSDKSGISISNSFNHQITATLNNDQVYILNDFYEAEIDNYQIGWISYPMDDLPRGKNILKVRVWDTHNNVTETILDFYVEEDARLTLHNVINYPNPFSEKTNFQFNHNAAGENLLVRLDIFSIKGEHVLGKEFQYSLAPSTINSIEWDGRNLSGQKLNEGIYIYKISIISQVSGLKNQQYKRLIIKN
jgi:hypothetical protein